MEFDLIWEKTCHVFFYGAQLFWLFSPLRNQKKESDLANALGQWRKVEATLSSKDAEYTKLLSENRSLSDDFTDLQGQLENVCIKDTCKSIMETQWFIV